MTSRDLARHIDHTLLKQDALDAEISAACRIASTAGCRTVCVYSGRVPLATRCLVGSPTGVSSTVGFPFGAAPTRVKALEAELAVEAGADEIDMVIDLAALRERDAGRVRQDVATVVEASGRPVKVILECGLLTDDEKRLGCRCAVDAGAAFVKTGTGYFGRGATLHDVRLLARETNGRAGVKAAGGIAFFEDAVAMLEAGATRLGVSHTLDVLGGAPDPR